MFFDEAKIYARAGDGGNGVVAFRREAHVPRGGPSGGNGGKGGNVFLVADPQINTLIAFSKQIHFRAPNGDHGRGKNQTGATGEDLTIHVPVGTIAYEAESGLILADLTSPDQSVLIVRGGHGGRGNWAFKSAINQAPRIAENGEPGEERWLRLELKLIADVGIVGVPNAGKSTLLSVVNAARPKIADYPFTTLEPNLGMVVVDNRDMVFADIPGLIEGAHMGAGLGHTFLRHIERTRAADPSSERHQPRPVGRLRGDQPGAGALQRCPGRETADRGAEQDGPARRTGAVAQDRTRAEEAGRRRTDGDLGCYGRRGGSAAAPGGRYAGRDAPRASGSVRKRAAVRTGEGRPAGGGGQDLHHRARRRRRVARPARTSKRSSR